MRSAKSHIFEKSRNQKSNNRITLFLAIIIFSFLSSPVFIALKAQSGLLSGFNFFGDFRLRYEKTSNAEAHTDFFEGRERMVVRFRTGFTKDIGDMFKFGVRMATGDPNDPNTADVTLGSFVDDLTISLDQLYLSMKGDSYFLSGGKFSNPFQRTDLVWDGDVNPQGLTGGITVNSSKNFKANVSGIYFLIDEHTGTNIPDSYMLGGQLSLTANPSEQFGLSLAGGYYDYDITNLNESSADAGDTRSNYLIFDSTGTPISYLSDFKLLDIIATLQFNPFGENYPVKVVGDYVKNLGAKVDEDQGFEIDLFVGRGKKKNDFKFGYGYSEAETDAVLAAFSNDNTTLPTNYIQHTLIVNYLLLDELMFDLTWYLYKPKLITDPSLDKFASRLRLNAIVKL